MSVSPTADTSASGPGQAVLGCGRRPCQVDDGGHDGQRIRWSRTNLGVAEEGGYPSEPQPPLVQVGDAADNAARGQVATEIRDETSRQALSSGENLLLLRCTGQHVRARTTRVGSSVQSEAESLAPGGPHYGGRGSLPGGRRSSHRPTQTVQLRESTRPPPRQRSRR